MTLARRVDGNQRALVDAARKLGMLVAVTSSLGKGFPDLVIGWRKRIKLFEVKDPARPERFRKLTPDEKEFFDAWSVTGQVHVVLSIDDVIASFEGE